MIKNKSKTKKQRKKKKQSDVLLVLDELDELPEDIWSEVDKIIQGRNT